jgi:hypothetical protein
MRSLRSFTVNNVDIDTASWFYKNCKRQRRRNAKICQECPFREGIEEQERLFNLTHRKYDE